METKRYNKLKIGSLTCAVATAADSTDICYMLMPMPLSQQQLVEWSGEHNVTLVSITGMDWDNDLTPWPAPNVPQSEPPFKGCAAQFLDTIKREVIPAIEGGRSYSRVLAGVSLSGLFTLWAWMQDADDTFVSIGSISGSFWYENFIAWLSTAVVHKQGKAYFSLGKKEGGPHVSRAFRDIQAQTAEVVEMLNRVGITTVFQPTQGTHYAPIGPRITSMLNWLYS